MRLLAYLWSQDHVMLDTTVLGEHLYLIHQTMLLVTSALKENTAVSSAVNLTKWLDHHH